MITSGCLEISKLGCNCNDKSNCKCVAVNETVELIPHIIPNSNHCGEDYELTYRLFINDELYEESNEIQEYELTFDNPGVYKIRYEAENCCGVCEYEREIVVGPPIVLHRVHCKKFQIINYLNVPNRKNEVFELRDINNNVLKSTSSNQFNQPKVFSLPSDGVYKFNYKLYDTQDILRIDVTFVIFEMCESMECLNKIVKEYACESCDCNEKLSDRENRRLFKVSLFVGLLTKFIQKYAVQYGMNYGYFLFEQKYIKEYKDQEFLIKSMRKLCNDCVKDVACSDCSSS